MTSIFSHNRMLWEGTPEAPTALQLNHASNYARYHLVSLVETLRRSDNPLPLRYLVLGCTHYPYEKDVLEETLQRLRDYTDAEGHHPYRDLIAPHVTLIDPALETARQLYAQLTDDNLLTTQTTPSTAAFYISVPVADSVPEARLDSLGRFTYEYKYGRTPGLFIQDVVVVPFSKDNIDAETINRLKTLPYTWPLLEELR